MAKIRHIDIKLLDFYNKKEWKYNFVRLQACENYCYGKITRQKCHYKEINWYKKALCGEHLLILHDYIKKFPNDLKIHHFNMSWRAE